MDQPRLARRYESVDLKSILTSERFVQMPPTQSRQRDRLIERMNKLLGEVTSEIHFRASYSLSAIAVVLLGAMLGIVLRGGQVLTAFGVSCIPSLVVVVCSIVGRNLADRPAYADWSVGVLWSSTILMYLATAVVAVKVLKR